MSLYMYYIICFENIVVHALHCYTYLPILLKSQGNIFIETLLAWKLYLIFGNRILRAEHVVDIFKLRCQKRLIRFFERVY